jgi:beta propeller repeat protein
MTSIVLLFQVQELYGSKIMEQLAIVYCKNLATGEYGKVLTTTENQLDPAISGTRVVWQQYNGNNWIIYCKNLATGVFGKVHYINIKPERS